MSYDIIESSAEDGRPIEVYVFQQGNQTWRYTSADTDIIDTSGIPDLSGTWKSTAIERSNIENNQDVSRGPIRISIPRTETFVQQYIQFSPTDVATLKIYRFHEFDTSPPADKYTVIWTGRVLNVAFKKLRADIRCEHILTSLKRPGLRRFYQTTCPFVLYGTNCKADLDSFKLVTNASATTNITITSPDFALQPDQYYTGGFINFVGGTGIEKRFITDHVDQVITVDLPISISIGIQITAYPGCNHLLDTCINKFSNEENYGGFPYIPQKNPFTDLVF